jgi:hypothetical protein
MLRGLCFKVGDKVRCVDRLRPEVYKEIGVVKRIKTNIGVLHVDFWTMLDNHAPYQLSLGHVLNISTSGFTGTRYLLQGLESLHTHGKDPEAGRNMNWEMLGEHLKDKKWEDNCRSKLEMVNWTKSEYNKRFKE